MSRNPKQHKSPMRFESMLQSDVPKGRDGKHKIIIQQLLSDIDLLEDGNALKIPLSVLPDSKENIRSALSRATRQKGLVVATSSDDEFLYVWRATNEAAEKPSGRKGSH
jgi:hypothetical protein